MSEGLEYQPEGQRVKVTGDQSVKAVGALAGALGAIAVLLTVACGGGSRGGTATPGVDEQRAISIAREQAGDIIGSGEVRRTAAELKQRGGTATWYVTLVGLFEGPAGPPPDGGSATPKKPECGQILVLVNAATGGEGALTFQAVDDC